MKVKIMILFIKKGFKTIRKINHSYLFLLIGIFILSCSSEENTSIGQLQDFSSNRESSFIIPSNGMMTLHAHHEAEPWVMAFNQTTSELFIFDYSTDRLVHKHALTDVPDWDPGRLYSLGFYGDGFYLLGANGFFVYDEQFEPLKAWRKRMTSYSEYGLTPSYLVSSEGKEYLIATYRNYYLPEGRESFSFYENAPYYRYISVIELDFESDSLKMNMIGGHPAESEVPKRIPSQGLRFTVYNGTINIVFRTEPLIWQIRDFKENPDLYNSIPMQLNDGKNNYLVTEGEPANNLKMLAENPSYDNFKVDRATGDHYFEYRLAFDEIHWPKIYQESLTWLNEKGGEFMRPRMVKYDSNFNKIYEIDKRQKDAPGFIQLVHDGKFFVGSPREPEFGQEYNIYRLDVKP